MSSAPAEDNPYRKKRGGRKGKKRNRPNNFNKKRNMKFQRKTQTTMIDTMNEFEDEDNQMVIDNKASVSYKPPKQRNFLDDERRKKLFGFDPHKDKREMDRLEKMKHRRPRKERKDSNSNQEVEKNQYQLAKEQRYREKYQPSNSKSFTPEGDGYDYQELAKLEPRLKPIPVGEGEGEVEGKHKYTLNWKEKGQSYYLNKAILQFDYGITDYDLPEDEGLVPAVPSRRDYIYWIRDLLESQESVDKPIKGLDIGVGAN